MKPRAKPVSESGPILTYGSAILAVLLVFGVLSPAAAAGGPTSVATSSGTPGTVFLNVSTTNSFAFAPDTLTVQPGQSVHLVVTQLADFNHTFLLSPVANFTFPATDSSADLDAFFALHAPLVNLSLGSTAGVRAYANFTAPAIGSYEFVCQLPDHFTSGMHGELYSGVAPPTSSAASQTLLYVGVAVAIVVVLGAAAFVLSRRHRSPPPSLTT
ncbi:MAG: cupredoxin domain-containing protein [Thermoplasmata archaeon]|nr:cupredoxin domain-containing protein [Thermoplasmata archaeon]